MSNKNTFGGMGIPVLVFDNGKIKKLPEPSGPNREGVRMYDFELDILDTFRSEGDTEVEVGKKFRFVAALLFTGFKKTDLKKLFEASAQQAFKFILNEDEDKVYFRVKVSRLSFKLTGGLLDSPAAYTVNLDLRGVELLPEPSLGALGLGSGYGTKYGEEYGND
jgi:hypothetical protein